MKTLLTASTPQDEVRATARAYHEWVVSFKELQLVVGQYAPLLGPAEWAAVLPCLQLDFGFLAHHRIFVDLVLDYVSLIDRRDLDFQTLTRADQLHTLLYRMRSFEFPERAS